jgi:hypothetical protein
MVDKMPRWQNGLSPDKMNSTKQVGSAFSQRFCDKSQD